MDKICCYCGHGFDVVGRVFSNHVRWCEKNPTRNNTAAIKAAVHESYNKKLGAIKQFEVKCHKCGVVFHVSEREKKFPEKSKYFCTISCANSKKHTDESNAKVSIALTGRYRVDREIRKCQHCNIDFEIIKTSNQKFCCKKCLFQSRKSDSEFLNYRHACRFKFNLWKYPDEFKLELIKEHGWYKAANRGNNLNGVSRDHRVSVMYGWENNISAEVISHPANCQLMRHNENSSKHKKCSLELQQLIDRIKEWDEKHRAV